MIQKNPIGICFTLTVNIDAVTPVFIETQSNDTAGMVKGGQMKGVAIFAKYFSGLPARKISKKSRDRQCLRLPRFVLLRSLHNYSPPFPKACIFTMLHFVKIQALRLSATKNLHFAIAPFPKFQRVRIVFLVQYCL